MTRHDALKVWEDLTRELWPEADVEKSALRIEHQRHLLRYCATRGETSTDAETRSGSR